MHEYFVFMVCVSCVCMVPMEVRREHWLLELKLLANGWESPYGTGN